MGIPSVAVQRYCEEHGYADFVRDKGFDYLLPEWKKTVEEISSSGYGFTIHEYLNDMDGRRIISELLPVADDAERATVTALLPALDALFFSATRQTDTCIWGEEVAAKYNYHGDRDWWYYRLPTNLTQVPDVENWP